MSKSLSEYNIDIIRLYKDGNRRDKIATELGIPLGHVAFVLKMVLGVKGDEPQEAEVETLAEMPKNEEPLKVAETPKSEVVEQQSVEVQPEEPKTESKVAPKKPRKQDNPEEKAKRLAKVLEKRSDEKFKELANIIKSEEQPFNKKDKAFFQLQLIYSPTYRQTYENNHNLTGVDDLIKEHGLEKAIRPVTKKEIQALDGVKKYYDKALEDEQEKRGKKIKPLYLREAGE